MLTRPARRADAGPGFAVAGIFMRTACRVQANARPSLGPIRPACVVPRLSSRRQGRDNGEPDFHP